MLTRSSHPCLLAATLALLAGCGGPPPAPSVTPPPPPSAAASTSAPDAAPDEVATTPPAPAPPPPAKEASPWVVVGPIGDPSRLFAVDGALFVVPDSGVQRQASEPGHSDMVFPLSVVRGGEIETPPSLQLEGLPQQVATIQGRWPDSVEMLAGSSTGRIGYLEHFQLTPRGWSARPNPCGERRCLDEGYWYLGMHQVGPSLVALTAPLMFNSPGFRTIRGPRLAPRMTPAPKECAHPESGNVPQYLVQPRVFGGTADGTLISVGNACTGGLAAEVWKPGAPASTITTLEPDDRKGIDLLPEGGKILTGIAQDAWVLDGKVHHYDGNWKEIPLPKDQAFLAGALAPDGTLWAVNDKGVWKRKGETWTEVPVPDSFVPTDVAVASDGEVWLSGSSVLLRLAHPGEAASPSLTAIKPPTGRRPRRRLTTAGSAACLHNLVILYAFTKVTPEDYTFPLTGKALKGHQELDDVGFAITRDGGKKYLAAQVRTFDAGKKLVALIEKKVAGSRPQIVCAEPEIVSRFSLDVKAGELQPIPESGP